MSSRLSAPSLRSARRLGSRLSALGLVALAACAGDKARADSLAAVAQRDSAAAAAVAATNAALATKARDDSLAAAAAAAKTKSGATKTGTTKTGAKQGVLGRDSVRQGPIIGLPSIKDTAKRRPPR